MDWTERHRPKSLRDVVGNGPSLSKLREWADDWGKGLPKRRAIILAGPPGTGKTSTAHALARDMGWEVLELNASDARNADTIRKVATAGATHHTFGADGAFHGAEGGVSKLIILDEADNLYERAEGGGSEFSDRGGKGAILETIRSTRQPIILIVNDLYALQKGSGAAFKSLADVLKFSRVQSRSMVPYLARAVAEEGIAVDRDVLEAIAVRSEGDVRSAIRDLESIALGRSHVTMAELASLGARDTETSLFDLMRLILKGRPLPELQRAVWSVDATPEDLVLWVDENLPREYQDPVDLVAGYEMLSRADIFLRRTRKTQDYGLWAYAGELSTLGVSAVRTREYRSFQPYGFPQYLMKMSRTKGLRQTKDLLAGHLGALTHSSKRKARNEMVETVALLFQMDAEFAKAQAKAMELTEEEIVLLLGPEATASRIKEVLAALKEPDADALSPKTKKARRGPLDDAATGDAGDDQGGASDADEDDSGGSGDAAGTVGSASGADDEKPAKPKPGAGQKSLFGF